LINSIRLHGKGAEKYDNVRVGLNSRLDTIQAAILIEKLKIFPEELRLRARVADLYGSNLDLELRKPRLVEGNTSAWAQYTIIANERDMLQKFLKDSGAPSIIYYPKALSQQGGYSQYPSVSTGLAVSERLPKYVLSLPMHPYLSEATIRELCILINEY
jgi:dTDP-4-amino-4,6-dideoxygalactose transaminase